MSLPVKPSTLRQLRESGWQSKPVKREIHDNFLAALARGDELFPGIVGYDSTVIPETNLALLAGHDMLFLGEKGQGKSRMMRSIVRLGKSSWTRLIHSGTVSREGSRLPLSPPARTLRPGPYSRR